jgi:hypothetical protein
MCNSNDDAPGRTDLTTAHATAAIGGTLVQPDVSRSSLSGDLHVLGARRSPPSPPALARADYTSSPAIRGAAEGQFSLNGTIAAILDWEGRLVRRNWRTRRSVPLPRARRRPSRDTLDWTRSTPRSARTGTRARCGPHLPHPAASMRELDGSLNNLTELSSAIPLPGAADGPIDVQLPSAR